MENEPSPIPKKRGGLLKRTLTTLVALAYFITMCFWGAPAYCVGVTLVVGSGLAEFVYAFGSEAEKRTGNPYTPINLLNSAIGWSGLALPVLAWQIGLKHPTLALGYGVFLTVVVGFFSSLTLRSLLVGKALGIIGQRAYGVIGAVYVGGLFSSFDLLRSLPGKITVFPFGSGDRGAWWMLCAAVCVWATDTCAYFIGKTLGRTPLCPSLSPGKTVEGSVGGFLGAVLAGAAFGLWVHLPVRHGIAVGIIAGLVGQVGDLFESALKREIGMKDFGRLMPGHGGMLDRADSLLFSIPLAYLYLRLFAGG